MESAEGVWIGLVRLVGFSIWRADLVEHVIYNSSTKFGANRLRGGCKRASKVTKCSLQRQMQQNDILIQLMVIRSELLWGLSLSEVHQQWCE